MKSATTKLGGAYLYANQQGCDGGRCYYDGCSMIWNNGNLLSQASQFSLKDVEVITASIDLDEIANYRNICSSRGEQSSYTKEYPRIDVDFNLTSGKLHPKFVLKKKKKFFY